MSNTTAFPVGDFVFTSENIGEDTTSLLVDKILSIDLIGSDSAAAIAFKSLVVGSRTSFLVGIRLVTALLSLCGISLTGSSFELDNLGLWA